MRPNPTPNPRTEIPQTLAVAMDGDAGGGGDPATGGRAGRGHVPARRPLGLRRDRYSRLVPLEEDSKEELGVGEPPELEEYIDDLVRPGSAALPSDRMWRRGRAEFARRHGHTVAEARTLIRQSVLYSDRPKRSRGRRGRVKPQTESLAEKDASEVSNSELGATTTDMPKFKTLSLNDSPSALDSADRRPGRAEFARRHGHIEAGARTRVRQSVLYSDRPKRSRGRRVQVEPQTASLAEKDASEASSSELGATTTDMPKFKTLSLNDSSSAFDSTDRATVSTGSMDSDLPDSATAELPVVEEALSPRSERIRKINLYLAEHTFDDLREGFAAMINGFRDPPKDAAQPNAELPESSKLYPREFDAESSQDSESLSPSAEDVARHNVSTEEIVQNGKRWMSEEVMLAFEKYIEGRNEFRDVVYRLDELQHQCFSVDAYQKIFHHYNFTVKMKKPTSEDWSLTCYFAEVKQVYGKKSYLCCPVKPHDNGYCHGCVNQGMVALKHPANDEVEYEIGYFDTGCPFMYLSDDGDDDSDDDECVSFGESIEEIFNSVFG